MAGNNHAVQMDGEKIIWRGAEEKCMWEDEQIKLNKGGGKFCDPHFPICLYNFKKD